MKTLAMPKRVDVVSYIDGQFIHRDLITYCPDCGKSLGLDDLNFYSLHGCCRGCHVNRHEKVR